MLALDASTVSIPFTVCPPVVFVLGLASGSVSAVTTASSTVCRANLVSLMTKVLVDCSIFVYACRCYKRSPWQLIFFDSLALIFFDCRCYERSPSCLSSSIDVVTNGLLVVYRLQLPLLRTVSLLVDFFKIMLEIRSISTIVVCYDTAIW
jgi:hypothetical protein